MAEGTERRCPNCRALVGEEAEWCGQCFTDLRSASPPQLSRSDAEPRIEVPVGLTRAERPDGHRPAARGRGGSEAPVRTDAGWPCAGCGRRNPMEASVCLSCGTPFGRGFEAAEQSPAISRGSALTWSLLYPGLGHLKAGRPADAIARAIVFTWPFVTGLLFLSAHPAGRLGVIGAVGIVFLVAAAFLYIAIALDAGRVADGDEPVISNRALLWIAAGIVVCSVVSAAVIGLSGMSALKSNG